MGPAETVIRRLCIALTLVPVLVIVSARAAEPADEPALTVSTDAPTTDSASDLITIGRLQNERRGFRLADTEFGDLNFSLWTYARYINSKGYDPFYTDAFGHTSPVIRRQDVQLSKVTMQFKGWAFDPRLRYFTFVWFNNNNQGDSTQTAIGGSLSWIFSNAIMVGAGITALPTSRSLELAHPRLNRVDVRFMAEEFFRGSYTTGVFVEGQPFHGTYYRVMLGNNLSQLGINAAKLDDQFDTFAAGFWWMPTGEYGPTGSMAYGGGYGDFEHHESPAARFGIHLTTSTEDAESQPGVNAPENAQIRLSDGTRVFAPGAFGDGINVDKVDFELIAVDSGIKYRGFALEGEAFARKLSNFRVNQPLPFSSLTDTGFSLQASYFLLPKTFQIYLGGSKIFGDYGNPWDLGGGINWFPLKTPGFGRQFRVNAELMHHHDSPNGYLGIPYSVGGNGPVFVTSVELWF